MLRFWGQENYPSTAVLLEAIKQEESKASNVLEGSFINQDDERQKIKLEVVSFVEH